MVLLLACFMQPPVNLHPFSTSQKLMNMLTNINQISPEQRVPKGCGSWKWMLLHGACHHPVGTSVSHQGIFLLAHRDRRRKREDGNRSLPQGGWERGLWWAPEAGGDCFNGRSWGAGVTGHFFVCLYLNFSWNNCFGF